MSRIYKITVLNDIHNNFRTLHVGCELDTLTILDIFDRGDVLFEMLDGTRRVYIEIEGAIIRLIELENY